MVTIRVPWLSLGEKGPGSRQRSLHLELLVEEYLIPQPLHLIDRLTPFREERLIDSKCRRSTPLGCLPVTLNPSTILNGLKPNLRKKATGLS